MSHRSILALRVAGGSEPRWRLFSAECQHFIGRQPGPIAGLTSFIQSPVYLWASALKSVARYGARLGVKSARYSISLSDFGALPNRVAEGF